MSLRFLSALLIALALLLAPTARFGDSAVALAAPVAAAQLADGHCPSSTAPAGSEKSGISIGCASACAAVHAGEPGGDTRIEARFAPLPTGAHPALSGICAESDTPPPRS